MISKFKTAYKWHKSNASKRGIAFLFTFEEWCNWWIETGKWEQRGVGKDKYCMCRFNDIGAYELGNVYCATNSKNLSDANKDKPKSTKTKQKMSETATGKKHEWSKGSRNVMHKPEVKLKFSNATKGSKHYKSKTVISPFGIFGSTTEASKELEIPAVTIQWRCSHNKNGWSYAIA
jgi:hypothetical protein